MCKKYLSKILMGCLMVFLFSECKNIENELLEPQVYFENAQFSVSLTENTFSQSLQSRLSSITSSEVQVSYSLGGADMVDEYNQKHGKEYKYFDISNVELSSNLTVIPQGKLYADAVTVTLKNLESVEEGVSYLLPIYIQSSSLSVVKGEDVAYFVISRPVQITKVAKFSSNYIAPPFLLETTPQWYSNAVTYEALVYLLRMNDNNTVMGTEGEMIFRIGEPDLEGKVDKLIQVAGQAEFNSDKEFEIKKWYHVAFTYDKATGAAVIYINGKKSAETQWSHDINIANGNFYVGKVKDFNWGERPINAYMSEVRVWTVARTENQIRENMLTVDPKSEGLLMYYKLTGEDRYEKDGNIYIKDASGHNMDGETERRLEFVELDTPVAIP